MNTRLTLRSGLAGLALVFASAVAGVTPAQAHEAHKKDKEQAQVSTQAAADYPVDFCVVSGDKLEDGDMGPPINYTHKQDGKSDRLVRLCCKSCVKDFKKDPEKFLKMIDEAAAAKAKGEKPATPATSGHGKH
jgi:hypothetical protein